MTQYRGWNISNENPPIPTRMFGWYATSQDYDCDCDEYGFYSCSGRMVCAETIDLLKDEIDDIMDNQ